MNRARVDGGLWRRWPCLRAEGAGKDGTEAKLGSELAYGRELHRIESLYVRKLDGPALKHGDPEACLPVERATTARRGSQGAFMGSAHRYIVPVAHVDIRVGRTAEPHRCLRYRL